MIELKAWQYAYGYVELNRSPMGNSGFQTFGYSQAGLSQDQAFEIQSRIAPRGEISSVGRRWQFFQLESGPFAFVQAAPLTERDSSGYGGTFMANGFLLSEEDFQQIENNPLVVFESASFAASQDDLLRGIAKGGDMPAVTLSIPDECIRPTMPDQLWSPDQLLQLANLGLRAKVLRQENMTIAFIGAFADSVSTLNAIITVIPPQQRPYLSFNTAFDGCNPVNNYFWGTGFARRPFEARYLVVDVKQHYLVDTSLVPGYPEEPYMHWLQATLAANQSAMVARWSSQAWTLCQLLRRETVALQKAEGLDARFAAQFLSLNRTELDRLVDDTVKSSVEPELVSVIRAGVESYYTGSLDRLRMCMKGLSSQDMENIVFGHYTEVIPSAVSKTERQAVANLAQAIGSARLYALGAVWSRDLHRLSQSAEQLTCADYRRIAEHALRDQALSLPQLIVPGHADCLLSESAHILLSSQILGVCRVLVGQHQVEALKHLSAFLGNLPARDLDRLEHILQNVNLPADFAVALRAACERARRNRPGILDSLRTALFREKDG